MSRQPGRYENVNSREKAIEYSMKRKVALQKQKKRARLLAYLSRVLFLSFCGAVLFFTVLGIILSVHFSNAKEKYEYSLSVSVEDQKVSLDYGVKTKDNTLYISLGDIAKLLDVRVMGDVKKSSLAVNDNEVISFFVDTSAYSIGGTVRNLSNNIFFVASNGQVYVPIDFLHDNFDGVVLDGQKKGKKIHYTLDIDKDISLSFSDNEAVIMPDMSAYELKVLPNNKFVADLSEYEKYMNPENVDEYLYLVNTENPLGEDYVPEDLTDISYTRNDRATAQMREYAAKALDAMFIEMKANGIKDVSVTSAYRSYSYQKQLFDNRLNGYLPYYDYDTAYAKTASMQAIPGTSEHQSGLCADMHNLSAASQAFASEYAYEWLVGHCADFGFILRYPKDKTDITGIIYEPWHYRYVGRYHAQKIMESGLCLEEYVARLKNK